MNAIRVGFVTGLAAESSVLRRGLGGLESGPDALIACAGASPRRARLEAERLVVAGAGALVSYGIAGGLDPGLTPGALVLAEAVIPPGGAPLPTDGPWRRALAARAAEHGLAPAGGGIAGSDRAVSAVAEKRELQVASGAVAVDMESHAVALVAREAGLPLAVIRAVADPVGRPLPRAVIGSIKPDGRPRGGLVMARLVLRPWEIPGVNRLGRDARLALRALGALTRALGPELLRIEM